MKNLKIFFSTIIYCLSLSWKSSKLYTMIRLVGKIITPILSIASTFLLKHIIDLLSGANSDSVANPTDALWMLIGGTAAISVGNALIQKLVTYSEGLHNDILDKFISIDMMEKALSSDLEMFDNPKYYDKFKSVMRDNYATTYILWNAIDWLSSLITFVGAFTVLFANNWWYGLLLVAAAFPSAIAGQKYTKLLYQLGLSQVNEERQKGYLYDVASTKTYAQDIRLFGIGDMLKQRYISIWSKMFSTKRKKIRSKTLITTILELLPELVIAFITINISFNVLGGNATVGDYSLYTGLIGQLWGAIFILTSTSMSIYENKLKIDNVKSFECIDKQVKDIGTLALKQINSIAFSHVSFAYPSSDKKVLNDVSFKISSGEHIVIVGVNGAGKSTLIKLLLRFYEVNDGVILINDKNIKEYKIESLRNCFSCYFQNTPNYGFTLKENIAIANIKNQPDEHKIINSLKECDCDSILDSLANGLDTYLTRGFEESGVELSGGQNQKIALARAFYRSSSALILDEPSSSLDPEAEHRLFKSIERICDGKITIFTSHRLSNITLSDRIVVIENGCVLEQGTCTELLKNKNRFAELYQYQADKFNTRIEE